MKVAVGKGETFTNKDNIIAPRGISIRKDKVNLAEYQRYFSACKSRVVSLLTGLRLIMTPFIFPSRKCELII